MICRAIALGHCTATAATGKNKKQPKNRKLALWKTLAHSVRCTSLERALLRNLFEITRFIHIEIVMGADSSFWSQAGPEYVVCERVESAELYAVDGSVSLYNVSRRGLGYETFATNPNDAQAVDKLADKWAAAVSDDFLAVTGRQYPKELIRVFFEGRPIKARHYKQSQGRTGKITKALKEMLKTQAPHLRHHAEITSKKKISGVFGRPDWWLTKIIAEKLAALGYQIDIDSDSESDHRITRWAAKMASERKSVTVISVDSDYLAFSPPGSVDQMASTVPRNPGKIRVIKKADVLKACGLTDLQFVIAFAIAGSDNIATHIKWQGWYYAVRYVKKYIPVQWTAANFAKRSPLKRLPGLIKWRKATKENVTELANNIVHKLGQFGWLDCALAPSPTQPGHKEKPADSELFRLAFELEVVLVKEKQLVRLVRPCVAGLVWRRYKKELGEIRSAQIKKQIEAIDKKYLDQKEAKAKGIVSAFIYKTSQLHKRYAYFTIKGQAKFKISKGFQKTMPIGGGISGPVYFPAWFEMAESSTVIRVQEEGKIMFANYCKCR